MSLPFLHPEDVPHCPAQEPFDIFKLLKKGTAEIHQQVEGCVQVFRHDFDHDDYRRLVERFYGFWEPVEKKLWALQELHDPKLALKSRLKSFLLREDILVLDRDPDAISQCDRLPCVDTFLKGLGCLYVLEGSTLGSRLISQRIESHLQLRHGLGASFFNAYGDAVGLRWKDFKNFVTERVDEEHTGEVVLAAQQTFHCLYHWLEHSPG